MQMEIIKIKCPWCNAVLSVRDNPANAGKIVTCPVCKKASSFSDFKIVNQENIEECTQYGFVTPAETQLTIGNIISQIDGRSYQLGFGRNVIGRKASNSTANIQIETIGSKRMSREHIVIEVNNIAQKGITHLASLAKDKVNETYVSGQRLTFGDCIVLKHGDRIELPDCTLIFEIPDAEATEI